MLAHCIRPSTPCCLNNPSQAPCSSCPFYSRTLRDECPDGSHINSKPFSLASPVALRSLIFASVVPANWPCSVPSIDWPAFISVNFSSRSWFFLHSLPFSSLEWAAYSPNSELLKPVYTTHSVCVYSLRLAVTWACLKGRSPTSLMLVLSPV